MGLTNGKNSTNVGNRTLLSYKLSEENLIHKLLETANASTNPTVVGDHGYVVLPMTKGQAVDLLSGACPSAKLTGC